MPLRDTSETTLEILPKVPLGIATGFPSGTFLDTYSRVSEGFLSVIAPGVPLGTPQTVFYWNFPRIATKLSAGTSLGVFLKYLPSLYFETLPVIFAWIFPVVLSDISSWTTAEIHTAVFMSSSGNSH